MTIIDIVNNLLLDAAGLAQDYSDSPPQGCGATRRSTSQNTGGHSTRTSRARQSSHLRKKGKMNHTEYWNHLTGLLASSTKLTEVQPTNVTSEEARLLMVQGDLQRALHIVNLRIAQLIAHQAGAEYRAKVVDDDGSRCWCTQYNLPRMHTYKDHHKGAEQ